MTTAGNRSGTAAALTVVLSTVTLPLAGSQTQTGAPAVLAAQRAPASQLSSSLPPTPLGTWLRDQAPDGAFTWETDDCGEQTGNPQVDRARDLPLCASVQIDLPGGRRVSLSFLVGTAGRGVSGKAAFYSGVFQDSLNAATGRGSADFAIRDLADATGFMSEARRVAQLGRFVTAIQLGMTRAEVERLLGNPPVQGGLTMLGHRRYYMGWDLTIDVPYETGPGGEASDRVAAPASVVRQPRTLD
jgi:hypothetical protein